MIAKLFWIIMSILVFICCTIAYISMYISTLDGPIIMEAIDGTKGTEGGVYGSVFIDGPDPIFKGYTWSQSVLIED